MVPACPLPGEGSDLLMDSLSIPKDGIKSWPTLRPPFHRLTHNLGPSQAGRPGGCGVCGGAPTRVSLSPTSCSHWIPLRWSSAAQTPATHEG